jgi:NADH-quinone oxidoreductase subunit N
MTETDLKALAPVIVLAASVVVVMLVSAFYRRPRWLAGLTLGGLALSLAFFPLAASVEPHQATPLVIVDQYALVYTALVLAATAAVVVFAYSYLRGEEQAEFYILLLLAALGSSVLVMSSHFASFFLGLEILSVSLYGLIAYRRDSAHALEAGIKYLTLAAASAAFLLFGMALIYADRGTMAFDAIATTGASPSALWLVGLGLMLVGFGFKLAVVPFHMWVPDVYEGAPAPVAAFVATVSKGAVFALLLRFSARVDIPAQHALYQLLGLIAVASMFGGNLLALMQPNVKRLLAYSSIAHLGYLIVAFLASGERAVTAATFYLVAYFITTLGAFGVMSALSGPARDADSLDDYRGLFWRRPALAAVMAASLFSLAGIPLTAGFVGKFYVLLTGAESELWLLSLALVLSSAIGLYYYLRVVVTMYLQPEEKREPTAAPAQSLAGSLVLGALTLGLVWLGVYPAPLIDMIQGVVSKLV